MYRSAWPPTAATRTSSRSALRLDGDRRRPTYDAFKITGQFDCRNSGGESARRRDGTPGCWVPGQNPFDDTPFTFQGKVQGAFPHVEAADYCNAGGGEEQVGGRLGSGRGGGAARAGVREAVEHGRRRAAVWPSNVQPGRSPPRGRARAPTPTPGR